MAKRKKLRKKVLCPTCDKFFVAQRAGRGLRKVQRCPFCNQDVLKPQSISELKTAAWQMFATYIKLRDSDDNGISAVCCTCGQRVAIGSKQCQAGHFLHGRTKGVLFSEMGVHVQCDVCNVHKGGNPDAYWPFMVRAYGWKNVGKLLIDQKRDQGAWTRDELQQIIRYYASRIVALPYGGLYEQRVENALLKWGK